MTLFAPFAPFAPLGDPLELLDLAGWPFVQLTRPISSSLCILPGRQSRTGLIDWVKSLLSLTFPASMK